MSIWLVSVCFLFNASCPCCLKRKRNDKKGSEWEISSNCMVRLSCHENLTSFGPQQGTNRTAPNVSAESENACKRCMRILSDSHNSTQPSEIVENKVAEAKLKRSGHGSAQHGRALEGNPKQSVQRQSKLCHRILPNDADQGKSHTFDEQSNLGSFRSLRCVEFLECVITPSDLFFKSSLKPPLGWESQPLLENRRDLLQTLGTLSERAI